MIDRLHQVLLASETRSAIIAEGERSAFSLISYSTLSTADESNIRRFQEWVGLNYKVAIPVVGGGYGCSRIEFEIVAKTPQEAAEFTLNIIRDPEFHQKALEISFKVLIINEPWTRVDLRRGTIEGCIDMSLELALIFSGISAISATIKAIKSAIEIKKMSRSEALEIAAKAEKEAKAEEYLALVAAKGLVSFDEDMEDAIEDKIKKAKNDWIKMVKNGDDIAQATDILRAEICKILRTIKTINGGRLPDDWYKLWNDNQCQ